MKRNEIWDLCQQSVRLNPGIYHIRTDQRMRRLYLHGSANLSLAYFGWMCNPNTPFEVRQIILTPVE